MSIVVTQGDLRKVARAARKRAEAEAEFKQAILIARASGETLTDIARAAGVTHQRVSQIVSGK